MVVDDADEAAGLAAAGEKVVLVVGEDDPVPLLPAVGPGRVAVFVATAGDEDSTDLARAMSAELFAGAATE